MLPGFQTREAMNLSGWCFLLRSCSKRLDNISSKDILARWAFPLVPDDNHPSGHNYEHRRGNRYFAKDGSVVLARYVGVT